MVHDMSWLAWHGIWFGLVGMAWYVVLPNGHGMVYGMAWRAWHAKRYSLWTWYGIWFGLARMLWYMVCLAGIAWCMVRPDDAWNSIAWQVWHMVWPGRHGMEYGIAWWA